MVISVGKTVDSGLQRTRESYTRDLSILPRFQFGAAFRKWGSLVLTVLNKNAGTVTVTSGVSRDMSRSYAIFCVHNFEVYGLTLKKCRSNKMEPQPFCDSTTSKFTG